MLKAFIKFLGGEEGEETKMWLLLGLGFFMGVFLATYQIGSESLFLQKLGEDYLDKAFFVTGFLGIATTALYVYLQARINFSSLVISNAFLIFLFVSGIRAVFYYIDYESYTGFQYLPFILFVMMGPVTALTLLNFWGTFGRLFDTKQAKRIIGGIDTGQLTATMIAFFSIPLITKLPFIDATYDLLFVSGIAAFGIFIFVTYIVFYWNLDKATKRKPGESIETVKYGTIAKDPYTRLLSLFLIFSVGVAVFVDFTFYSTTEVMFTDPETHQIEEEKLNTFLSFFSGTIIIMSFIIQSFINDIIIGKFGLKIALMTMPVILILFTIGGIVTGHIFGFEERTDDFLLFFMFTVSAKAFTASLRDALESPAFKLFFLPFNIKIRFDVQTRIEGVINEFATLAAGAAQIGLGFMVFFKLIHYSYLILGLAGMVIWLAFKLYGEYKETLKKTLLIQKEELRNKGKLNENSVMNLLRAEFSKNKPARILHALRIYEKLDPLGFEFVLLDMLKVKFPTIRQYAYSKLLEHKPFEFLEIVQREIKTEGDDEALRLANEVVNMFTHLASYELNDQSIRELIRSTEAKDRALGACLLSKMTDDKYLAFELELLRDINPHVHIAAIKTAGKLKRPEVWPVLVENLHLASYSNAAVSAICHTGESAFYQVDASFYKTGQYQSTMFRIVQILGRLRSKQSTELLWKKIDFPDKKIISEVLLSLSFTGFQARDFMKSRIQLFIEDMIGDIAWNIKALQDIPVNKSEADQLIRHAFIEENKINYDNIFMLMGMIYDPQSVLLVKENIEAQTVDSVMFAVEMMDVFLDEELKPKIIPVMDDIKDSDRLEKLLNFYPPEEFTSYEDLLKQVINRDYNRISRYTKALALYRLQHFDELSVSFDLIANLFNPDPVLIQTAANTIYNIDKGAYDVNTRRLKVSIKKELDRAILPPVFLEKEDEYFPNLLLIDRILFLKRKKEFSRIPGEIITHMAEVMEEIKVFSGTRLIDVGDAGTIPFYFIIRGEVEVRKNGDEPFTISDGGFFGEELILESECFEYEVIATKTSSLLVLRKEELFDLMSKHIEIMDTFLRILNSENESEEKEEVFDIDIFN